MYWECKELRKSKKITIVELADVMGVSQSYISKIERGVVPCRLEQIENIKRHILEIAAQKRASRK